MFCTKEQLKTLLRKLGLRSGMNILLDAEGDFSHFVGGERMILEAVKEIVGYESTILVESFTPSLVNHFSRNLLLDYEDMLNIDYSNIVFEAKKSLPDCNLSKQLLVYEDALRSNHPIYSFLAWGKYAQTVTNQHPLHFARAKNSPIDKLFGLGAFYLSFNALKNTFFDYIASASNVGSIQVNAVSIIDKSNKVEKFLLDYDLDRSKYAMIMNTLLEESLFQKEQLLQHDIYFGSMRKTAGLISILLTRK